MPPRVSPSVALNPDVPPPQQVKKEKPAPAARSSGLTAKELQTCTIVLRRLGKHKAASFFRHPVDPVRDRPPGYVPFSRSLFARMLHPIHRYFDKISHPMDLSTMEYRLNHGHYKSRDVFRDDFKLIISNALTYNLPGSHPYMDAEVLNAFFDKSEYSILTQSILLTRDSLAELDQPSRSTQTCPCRSSSS